MTDIGYTLSAPSVGLFPYSQIPRPTVSRSEMKLLFKLGALKPDALQDSVPKQELFRKLFKIRRHQLGPALYRYCLDPIK